MKTSFLRCISALAILATIAVPHAGVAQTKMPITPSQIDTTVDRAMKAFKVPGVALAIIQDGHVVYIKGYGVREFGKPGAVDTSTLFQIGSTTKAFTAAALSILVDEGKIHWDDKVIQYIPEFQMYDPYVTSQFTIRDLLAHRSGLGEGAGDLMFYPSSNMTRAELIHGLRYLKPVSSFRSEYDYDNVMYMVAGEIIPRVTGQSWEDFVTDRIFKPLHMDGCSTSLARISDHKDVSSPHVILSGKVTPRAPEDITTIDAAGGIVCNADGMSKWLQTQLGEGTAPDGTKLFSADRSDEMWTENTIEPLDPTIAALTHSHFKGYALGWEVSDDFGLKTVFHTGDVPGSLTWVTIIPELKLAVVVLTNQNDVMPSEAIGHQILDAYVGAPKRDMVAMLTAYSQAQAADAQTVVSAAENKAAQGVQPTLALADYSGVYTDPWRGTASVKLVDKSLILKFSRTNGLEGSLVPYNGNIFIVHWNDRSLNADAYVRFTQGFDGKIEGMTMQPVSPTTDTSFDFHDLNFQKTADGATQ